MAMGGKVFVGFRNVELKGLKGLIQCGNIYATISAISNSVKKILALNRAVLVF